MNITITPWRLDYLSCGFQPGGLRTLVIRSPKGGLKTPKVQGPKVHGVATTFELFQAVQIVPIITARREIQTRQGIGAFLGETIIDASVSQADTYLNRKHDLCHVTCSDVEYLPLRIQPSEFG